MVAFPEESNETLETPFQLIEPEASIDVGVNAPLESHALDTLEDSNFLIIFHAPSGSAFLIASTTVLFSERIVFTSAVFVALSSDAAKSFACF